METNKEKRLEIVYFALLKEERGQASETIESSAFCAADLYEELKGRHNLTLNRNRLCVAINDEMADWQNELHEGDLIAFIPPVAGG
ncbi:MAG: MoaD/ThiS family protein [Candidatus Obscuribacterales bacterium]|nr:MoaD/ThiS family protein [Candidatus Obscuribacterales bacterium]